MKNFLLIMLCLVCFLFGYFTNSKTPTPVKTATVIYQIDSIIVNREHYIMDSVKTTLVSIERIHDSSKSNSDRTFTTGTKVEKQNLFNSYYTPYDTNWLMMITEHQAKAAIDERINHIKDSSDMIVYKKSAEDADSRLKTIKTKVDTLKITVKADADSASSAGFKKGIYTTSAAVIALIALITGSHYFGGI